MLKKSVAVIGLVASLMATAAFAFDATHCVRKEGNYLVNACGQDVEAAWCYGASCGLNQDGNQWTIRNGAKMPLDATKSSGYTKFAACTGANSIKKTNNSTVDCN